MNKTSWMLDRADELNSLKGVLQRGTTPQRSTRVLLSLLRVLEVLRVRSSVRRVDYSEHYSKYRTVEASVPHTVVTPRANPSETYTT
jgi:hypothetical protein